MKTLFDNKVVLVTGGTGSIGYEISKTLLKNFTPKQVRIFDNNEEKIFFAHSILSDYNNARFLLGDVRDKDRVLWASRGVDLIFHAAALKHVALNEYNPFEAVKTNVLGTENVVMAAIKNKARKLINISTDKASSPNSTMGATKLLAERITSAANYYKGDSPTVLASVRFGNVLGTSGSAVPIFLEQIKQRRPITLTRKDMIRYFMTVKQAMDLIFKSAQMAQGGEVFILKMSALKLTDLVEVLIADFAKQGFSKYPIKEIGMRPGEKVIEKLITSTEENYALEMKEMYIVPPLIENINLKRDAISQKIDYYRKKGATLLNKNNLKKLKILNKKEIRQLLRQAEIIK